MDIVPNLLTYRALKERQKIALDNLSYSDILLQIAASMYAYNDTGDLRTEWIEAYLLMYGQCAVLPNKELTGGINATNDGLAVCMASRIGTPDVNGLGRDLLCMTFDGRTTTIKDFETTGRDKVVYVKNNLFATPDFTIGETGNILSEISESTRHNVVNSRLTPIIIAKDQKAKKAIEKALEENRCGTYSVVCSDNIFSEGQEFVLKATDVKDQDKIQYLNHAYDDIMRHWYNLHGMDISGTAKLAQQSVDEVSSGTNSHKILPIIGLRERKKAVERINALYGLTVKVNLAEPWLVEFGMMETPVDEAERMETLVEETERTEKQIDVEESGEDGE